MYFSGELKAVRVHFVPFQDCFLNYSSTLKYILVVYNIQWFNFCFKVLLDITHPLDMNHNYLSHK